MLQQQQHRHQLVDVPWPSWKRNVCIVGAIVSSLLVGLEVFVGWWNLAKDVESIFTIAYVGSSFNPDGTVALWGNNSKDAFLMALDDANKNGWCGHNCKVVLPDSLMFEANGTAGPELDDFVRTAVSAGVVAIVGADWGRVAEGVLSALTRNGSNVPLFSGGASGASLGNATEYPNFIRTIFSERFAVDALLQNLIARATASNETSPDKIAVLSSNDAFGDSGLKSLHRFAGANNVSVISQHQYESGSTVEEVRVQVKKMLADSVHGRPMVFVSANVPDTRAALIALAQEGVRGPPTDTWIVGATEGGVTEALGSVVHSAADASLMAGYISYVGEHPKSGTCKAADEFASRFHSRFQRMPNTSFEKYSYDGAVLLSKALAFARNAASGQTVSSSDLLRAIRDEAFAVQGLSGRLMFKPGVNQPSDPMIQVRQLLESYDGNSSHEAPVASTVAQREDTCPRAPVADTLKGDSAHSDSPTLRFLCTPEDQNLNKCGEHDLLSEWMIHV